MRFIHEPVTVETDDSGTPTAFSTKVERFAIAEVLTDYRVVDLAPVWYRRRHGRRLFVRVADGRVFELRQEKSRRGYEWWLFAERPDPLTWEDEPRPASRRGSPPGGGR